MRYLQFVQQQAGVSRRQARSLIEAGKVFIDGAPVENPFSDTGGRVKTLKVDGREVPIKSVQVGVYKYYKPRGMLCSFADPYHHHAMGKVLRRPELKGYKIVGRLDRDAEGLLLLTNDGALNNLLAHPRYQVEKVYHVLVPKIIRFRQANDTFRQMAHGIQDAGETLRIVRGRVLLRTNDATTLVIVLTEGKNHEVKRLCKRFGWYVQSLTRVEMAGVQLGKLRPGELRPLAKSENLTLRQVAEAARLTKPRAPKGP